MSHGVPCKGRPLAGTQIRVYSRQLMNQATAAGYRPRINQDASPSLCGGSMRLEEEAVGQGRPLRSPKTPSKLPNSVGNPPHAEAAQRGSRSGIYAAAHCLGRRTELQSLQV